MNKDFHIQNRRHLYDLMLPGSVFLCFSGEEVRKTNDEHYPFYADRNFLYLTGIEQKQSILLAVKTDENSISESRISFPRTHSQNAGPAVGSNQKKHRNCPELNGSCFLIVMKRTSIRCLPADPTVHARKT